MQHSAISTSPAPVSPPLIIAGRAHPTAQTLPITNPATGAIIGHAPKAGQAEVEAAVAAATGAFTSWSRTSNAERKAACHRIADVIEAHHEELARLVTLESGKPLAGYGARFEVGAAAAWARAPAQIELLDKVLKDDATGRTLQTRTPIGVCASITPWNWPLMIAIWHLAPAVRSGNTIIVKPSPFTPLSTLRLVELINQALPPGVVNSLSGSDELGPILTSHAGVRKIIFTGSIPTGKAIMRSAADDMKRLTLELGGNDAAIILPGAEIAPLAERLFWGAFMHSGQTCAALKRLYVHEDQYAAVCEALRQIAAQTPLGDGLLETSALGPLQSAGRLAYIEALVADARAQGCRILCGGERLSGPGFFYPITLVADAKDGHRLVDEEQFGPVLPIISYRETEDAVAAANRLPYGLAASVWGQDLALAAQVAARLQAGTVYVNKHADIAPDTPFGGVKSSGFGVEFGVEGLEAYTDIKVYALAPDAAACAV